jgi:hypothetical protein
MVEKDKFCDEVIERATEYYKDKARVSRHDVVKNNSLNKTGLCVTLLNGNCGPTIYLDDYYSDLKKGKDFESVFNDIIEMLDSHLVEGKVDFSFFADYDEILDKICFRLIGAARNEGKLEGCPHRIIEDLAVTYFVSMAPMGLDGSVAIKNELMNIWKVTEEDLFEAALDNTPRIYPSEIITMNEFIKKQTGHDFFPGELFSKDFLIGSNEKYINGASIILYPGLLKEIGEYFGGNYYIIPSSVHEILFIKELYYESEPGTLEDMIQNVNSSCVLPEDVLSDSLYYYDRATENNIKKVEQVRDTMLL